MRIGRVPRFGSVLRAITGGFWASNATAVQRSFALSLMLGAVLAVSCGTSDPLDHGDEAVKSVSSALCSQPKLTITPASPVPVDGRATLTASVTCGAGDQPAQYRFSQLRSGTDIHWQVIRDFAPGNTHGFETAGMPAGQYRFRVEIRRGASTVVDTSAAVNAMIGRVCHSLSLSPPVGDPPQLGVPISLQASVSCSGQGTQPEFGFEYQHTELGSPVHVIPPEWGTDRQRSWGDEAGLASGRYVITARSRAQGNTSPGEGLIQRSYLLGDVCTHVSLTAAWDDRPALDGSIRLTASSRCLRSAEPRYQFVFRREDGTVRFTPINAEWGAGVLDWNVSALPPGLYGVAARVRGHNNRSDYEASHGHGTFWIGRSCYAATLRASPPQMQTPGTTVRLDATATCTPGASALYKFVVLQSGGGGYATIRDWLPDSTATWTPTSVATGGRLSVWVMASGNESTPFEAAALENYVLVARPSLPACTGTPGATTFCDGCLCGVRQGNCDSGAECGAGLVCIRDVGHHFSFTPTTDVCLPNHCANQVRDGNETGIDCGGPSCAPCLPACNNAAGAQTLCRTCQCSTGEGDCDWDHQCQPGLVCSNDDGPKFGLPSGFDVCIPPHCTNNVRDEQEQGTDCGGACGACRTCTGAAGADSFCKDCACAVGQGDCDSDRECGAGLVCVENAGAKFSFTPSTSVCLPAHCGNDFLDTALGETGVDCGGSSECGPCLPDCAGTAGPESFCEGCRCSVGQGDCDTHRDCRPGLYCAPDLGAQYGLAATTDVCVPAVGDGHCANGVRDRNESGVDCGGSCRGCAQGASCAGAGDCGAGLTCRTVDGACFSGSVPQGVCGPAPCNGDGGGSGGSGGSTGGGGAAGTGGTAVGGSSGGNGGAGGACIPNCASKVCGDDPFDGCEAYCTDLCDVGQVGCHMDQECRDGSVCAGISQGSTVADTCIDPQCLLTPLLLGCGFPGAFCGPTCTINPECEADNDCPSGQVCGVNNGYRFGAPGKNICEPANCPAAGCGSVTSPCGVCECTPDCSAKQCGDADLSNGCGGQCTGVCDDREPGCRDNADCRPGSVCMLDAGARVGLASGADICLPADCSLPAFWHLNCGAVQDRCGECPPRDGICNGRECGTDPITGAACGSSCAAGQFCNATGSCSQLTSTPPIVVTTQAGTRPIVPPQSPPAPNDFGAIPAEFSVSDRGSATYVIPIDVPPGRNGMEPRLSLRYASSTGNGALGVGWSLDGLSVISACPKTFANNGGAAPTEFPVVSTPEFCLDGQKLVRVRVGEYRTEVDSFAKVLRSDSGFGQWNVFTKDGRILLFSPHSEYIDGGLGSEWARVSPLVEIADRSGNTMNFRYRQTSARDYVNDFNSSSELLPEAISYTGSDLEGMGPGDREVRFIYSSGRQDPLSGYQMGGGLLSRTQILTQIRVSAGGELVRQYEFRYETAPNATTRLHQIVECAGREFAQRRCKAPTTFTYYDESGFDSGTSFIPPVDPITGVIHSFPPSGTVLQGAGTASVLAHINASGSQWVTTPLPGGADMALMPWYFFAAAPTSGGASLPLVAVSTVMTLVNLFGASVENDVWYTRYVYSYAGNTYRNRNIDCRRGALPADQFIRTSSGGDVFHDICPAKKVITVPDPRASFPSDPSDEVTVTMHYYPRSWLVDVDGDGTQDKLFCAANENDVFYALSNGDARFSVPLETTEVGATGSVPAVANLCRIECTPNIAKLSALQHNVNCQADGPATIVMDVNGDGAGELLVFEPTVGWSALSFREGQPSWRTVADDPGIVDFTKYLMLVLDANGDGLRDIVALPSRAHGTDVTTTQLAQNPPFIWTNNGRGLQSSILGHSVFSGPQNDLGRAPKYPPYVMDFDRDGVEDIVQPSDDVPGSWVVRKIFRGSFLTKQILSGGPQHPGVLGDFDGDGNPDVLTREPPNGRYLLHRGTGRRQSLLKDVRDGMGRRTEVKYDAQLPDGTNVYDAAAVRLGDECLDLWPKRCLSKVDHPLVSSVRQGHEDGSTTAVKWTGQSEYTYRGARADAAGGGWLGFSHRTVTLKDAAGVFLKKTELYSVPVGPAFGATPWTFPYTRVVDGLLEEIQETLPDVAGIGSARTRNFQKFTRFEWEQQQSAAGRPFPVLRKKTTRVVTREGTLFEQVEAFQVDAYGNTTDVTVTSRDFIGVDPVPSSATRFHVATTFSPTTAEVDAWLISLPKAQLTESQPRCSDPVSCEENTRRRHWTADYYPDTNLVRTVTRERGNSALGLTTTFVRDGLGNVEEVVSVDAHGDARGVLIGYDNRRLFPVSFIDSRGRVTDVRMDDRFGAPTAIVDPNDIDQTFSYDEFGVLRIARGPEGEQRTDYEAATAHQSDFGFSVAAAVRVHTEQEGGGFVQREFNALGQLVEVRSSGLNGATVVEEFLYNGRGLLQRRTRPHLPSDTSQATISYDYDDWGRIKVAFFSDGTQSRREYGFVAADLIKPGGISFTKAWDQNNHATIVVSDRDDQAIAVVDPSGQHTDYEYGAFGTIVRVRLPADGELTSEYDAYGRVVSSTDAALGGTTENRYNAFDDLTHSTDAAGRETSAFYDNLGRLERVEQDAYGTTQLVYDGDETSVNAIGRLVREVSPSGQVREYEYEAPETARNRGLLRRVKETLVAPSNSSGQQPRELITTYHYDEASRLTRVDYPGNSASPFSVQYDFDVGGNVTSASDPTGSTVYWELLEAHQGARIKRERFGNGVETERVYKETAGTIEEIVTRRGGVDIQRLEYDYNGGGGVTARRNLLTGVAETFVYDALDRLDTKTTQPEGTVESYRYGSLSGRLEEHAGMSYGYSTSGRDWVQTAGPQTYDHDGVGNIRLRTGPQVPGERQEIAYTPFGLPERITSGDGPSAVITEFAYDATGTRAVKKTGPQATYYSGKLYAATVQAGGQTSHRFMIFGGGRAVAAAMRPETAQGAAGEATLQYLHDDLLGSIQTVTAAGGGAASSRSFAPFGAVDGGPPVTAELPLGFTGHEEDVELGLTNMNGRMYDPVLGQFLSPDPLIQQPYGQGLNRFAYAFNSPLNYTDPTGFTADATTVGIDAGLGLAYGVGLYATLNTAASIGAGTTSTFGVGAAAAGMGAASSGAIAASTGAAAGVSAFQAASMAAAPISAGLSIVNAAIGAGRSAQHTSFTVTNSSSGRAPSPGTPSYGHVSSATASAPVQEGPPGTSLFDPEAGALACGPATQMCMRIAQAAMNSPAGRAAQRAIDRYGPQAMNWLRAQGAQLAQSIGRFIKGAEAWRAPSVFTNRHGQLTNGAYTLDLKGMEPHITGSLKAGKSQFLYGVNERQLVLDGAAYADKLGAWVGNKAKITFNVNIGVHGKTGELTNVLNVYRSNTGFVHGAPGTP